MLRLISTRNAPGGETGYQVAGSAAVPSTRSRRYTLRWGRVTPSGWRSVYARDTRTGRVRRLNVHCKDADGPDGSGGDRPDGDDPPPSAPAAGRPSSPDPAPAGDALTLPCRATA
jgi:hypothetical protein